MIIGRLCKDSSRSTTRKLVGNCCPKVIGVEGVCGDGKRLGVVANDGVDSTSGDVLVAAIGIIVHMIEVDLGRSNNAGA